MGNKNEAMSSSNQEINHPEAININQNEIPK